MAPKNLKVLYFDARGRAEVLRILLAAAGQDYEDVRFTKETWPAEKPNTPFGQVPCLEVDGRRFGQSVAISNYLAREFGFYGKNNLEALEIDQVVQLTQDLIGLVVRAFFEPDEALKAKNSAKLKDEDCPRFLGLYEKVLENNGTGYFVGSSITLADIVVFDILDTLKARGVINFDGFSHLKTLFKNVESNDKIGAYLKSRKPYEG